MDSNNDPASHVNPENLPPTPYNQMPPPPEVEQLTTMKVDPSDAPQPGTSFSADTATTQTEPAPSGPPEPQTISPSSPAPVSDQPAIATSMPPGPTAPSPMPTAPQPNSGNIVMGGDIQPATSSPPPSRRRISLRIPRKAAIIAILAIIILGGGAALAYVAVILPNSPSNILKSAITNSLNQPNDNVNGTIQLSQSGSGAFKLDLTAMTNRNAKSADVNLNLTYTGVSFQIEGRLVNGNVYFKLGDLSEIASLLSALSPTYAGLAQTLSTQVSNKWIAVDSTLIDSSGLNCYLNASWNISNSDMQTLENLYTASPFMTINSTNQATVDGQTVDQFHITLDNKKLAAFGGGLNKLSIVRQFNKCPKSPPSSSLSSVSDNGTTPITISVNRRTNEIIQLTTASTVKDAQQGVSGNLDINFSYKPVSITAPANAEPIVQLLAQISGQLKNSNVPSQLFSGFSQ
ncbi:MAG TPA: hypothetical protein VFN31_00945 [Candidatus Saccharimonadales bacterium]|nr:hypothetical protein [Candidatus Saccharimonadales bacterium]